MPPRIILTVTNDLSIDQRVHRVATTLRALGWEVTAVGRALPDSPPLPARPYTVRRLRVPARRGPLFYALFNIRLFFHLLFQPAHTLLSNDLDTLPACWLAARLRGRRLLYDSHELWTELPELVGRPKVRAVWAWLERRLFPRVDGAMTVNASIAQIYSEQYGLRVAAVRNLPLRQPPTEARATAGRMLIYQGALNVGRGIDLMIRAMRHLPEEYTLNIAGRGPESGALQALVAELGLTGRVSLLGHVPFERLPALTQGAALGMSLEEDMGMSYRLASPNKLFDYIQAGVPALVSDLPEMRAVVETHGVGQVLKAEERRPEALAQRIRGLVEDEAAWQALHQKARKAAEALCWEKEQAVLAELVGRPGLTGN